MTNAQIMSVKCKAIRNGGYYFTRKYYYIVKLDGCLYRTHIAWLDTTRMYEPDAWEKID